MAIPLWAIFLAVFIHILWGGNTVAVKMSLEAFPPLWSAFFRFSLGIICIYAWARYHRISILPSAREWPLLLLLGVIFTVQIGTMNIGVDLSTGSIASILMASNPLFAALFARLLIPDDHISAIKAFGFIIAFAGTVLILFQDNELNTLQLFNWGNWILFFSAALLGLRLAFSAQLLRRIDMVRVLLWQMAISLPLFAYGGYYFEAIAWHNISWWPLAGLLYQGLVIAGVAFMINAYLMKRYQPSVVVSFNFVSPISGVVLSIWLLDEPLTWHVVAGTVTVGVGLYLIAARR